MIIGLCVPPIFLTFISQNQNKMRISRYFLPLLVFFAASCRFGPLNIKKGNGMDGSIKTEVGSFSGVTLSGSVDVILKQGPAEAVKVTGDENLLQYVRLKVEGNTLRVYMESGISYRTTLPLRVYITNPEFKNISVSGSGELKGDGTIKSDSRISIAISGSGNLNLDLDAPDVECKVSGSGNANLKGMSKNLAVNITGSGTLEAVDLRAENTRVEVSGSGDASVFASVELFARVSGSGDIKYSGTPAKVDQKTSGSGSISKN